MPTALNFDRHPEAPARSAGLEGCPPKRPGRRPFEAPPIKSGVAPQGDGLSRSLLLVYLIQRNSRVRQRDELLVVAGDEREAAALPLLLRLLDALLARR